MMHRIQPTKAVPGFGPDPDPETMCNIARMCICARGLNQYLGPMSKSTTQVLSPLGKILLQSGRICLLFVGWPAELLGDGGALKPHSIESTRCDQLLLVWRHVGHMYMSPVRPAWHWMDAVGIDSQTLDTVLQRVVRLDTMRRGSSFWKGLPAGESHRRWDALVFRVASGSGMLGTVVPNCLDVVADGGGRLQERDKGHVGRLPHCA